jgi:flagellum-specific peptidoglycan hydrolase FlgJ
MPLFLSPVLPQNLQLAMRKAIFISLSIYFLLVFGVPYLQKEINSPHSDDNPNELAPPRTSEDSIRLYIKKYKIMAIEEMHRAGIPASITLAQAVLESRYGTSELATFANNHFGIKMGEDWTGGKYYVYSNEWNSHLQRLEKRISCFRAYHSPAESYSHHSDFIRQRPHYQNLFRISRTDYRAWAEGLKKSGYATDPDYAAKLVSLIERFSLHQYDTAPLPIKTITTYPDFPKG